MRRFVAAGAAFGGLVWLYDHDFLLNAGGPAAPISRHLLETLHLTHMEYPAIVLMPLIVLVLGGALTGVVVGRLAAVSRGA